MRPAVIATRDEARLGSGDRGEGHSGVGVARNVGGIGPRADDYKIVVGDEVSVIGMARIDQSALRVGRVHEQGVGVAFFGQAQRGAGADRDRLHVDVHAGLEDWDERLKEAAVLDAGGRSEDQVATRGGRGRAAGQHEEGERNEAR